jgi:hypothetical protein
LTERAAVGIVGAEVHGQGAAARRFTAGRFTACKLQTIVPIRRFTAGRFTRPAGRKGGRGGGRGAVREGRVPKEPESERDPLGPGRQADGPGRTGKGPHAWSRAGRTCGSNKTQTHRGRQGARVLST